MTGYGAEVWIEAKDLLSANAKLNHLLALGLITEWREGDGDEWWE